MIEFLKAILFGIVEGITEWLPISSTGHLILLDEFISLNVAPNLDKTFADEYFSMFEVVIQLGAILAVVVMFFSKLNPLSPRKTPEEKLGVWKLWGKVLIASIPAALIGIVGDKLLEKATGKDIDGWIYNWICVSAALIIYGILFIIIEKKLARSKNEDVISVNDISCKKAFAVGLFQAISIVPGTSRSGSTILGSRMIGISKEAAAEFSFFMGIPAMAGASLIKGAGFFSYVSESGVTVPLTAWLILLVASAVAFIVSIAAIKFLMDFIKKHSFAPFGVYRIVLGAIVIGYFLIRG
ncbi:MAG: undecaprenyl-diphosphate phosphatase [Clostridia bacterium]|nr:undecaprenyl-diphosphate phosphatase [Clostridia bacterium]